jgi:hypothetical protein
MRLPPCFLSDPASWCVQAVFVKLGFELQKKIGLKVLERGGNCVLGYRQHFDLEGDAMVARGIGTAATATPRYSPSFCLFVCLMVLGCSFACYVGIVCWCSSFFPPNFPPIFFVITGNRLLWLQFNGLQLSPIV